MAYDQELAQRVRELLKGEAVAEKAMFGGLAFLVDGHMAVAVGQDDVMVRVEAAQLHDLLGEPGTDEVVMGSRVMRGWLRVADEAVEDDEQLGIWVTRGLDVVRTLPPK